MSFKVDSKDKHKYFVAVLYPDSMVENWQEEIGYLLQKPYAYCIHNADSSKTHVHVMVAYRNNTTVNAVLKLYQRLQPSCVHCEPCDVEYMYNYIIHDTEDCRKKGKHLYSKEERILGNGFDICSYREISKSDKMNLLILFISIIREQGFNNFADFIDYIMLKSDEFDIVDLETAIHNSGFIDRYCNARYWREHRAD